MDTHIAPAPEVEEHGIEHDIPLSARLPGEPDPDAGRDTEPAEASERLATSTQWARAKPTRAILLGGAAVAAGIVVVMTSAALLFSMNRVVSVPPKVAASLHLDAKGAGSGAAGPFAPSAALASLNLPSRPSAVILPRYTPPPNGQDLAELLSIRPGSAAAGVPNSPQTSSSKPAKAAVAAEAFVPHEPGSSIREAAAATPPSPPKNAPPTPLAAVTPTGLQPGATAIVEQAEPVAPHQDVGSGVPRLDEDKDAASPQQNITPDQATPAAVPPVNVSRDAVKKALYLQAGPMSSEEQVKVLELVTQMAAIVRDLKSQNATLRADVVKASADDQARLADLARRIDLAEATNAVAAAKGAGERPAAPALRVANPLRVQPAMALSPIAITRADAALPSTPPEAAKRYRVQAASPGLALLTEIARGGGDGAQVQVTVGDVIPGWGKVKSVAQRGTSWVVRTEHGVIE